MRLGLEETKVEEILTLTFRRSNHMPKRDAFCSNQYLPWEYSRSIADSSDTKLIPKVGPSSTTSSVASDEQHQLLHAILSITSY